MSDTYSVSPDSNYPSNSGSGSPRMPQIVIRNEPPKQPWFGKTMLKVFLALSIFGNFALYGMYQQYYPNVSSNERFHDGERYAEDKVAIIKVSGMIMSETIRPAIKELKLATDDDSIKAVVLSVDTPGGTISGSDELYHALRQFKSETGKPLVVSMSGMATSGGYYVSVPADKIFADRSCMTGSIGVILSSITIENLLQEWGVESEVIKSGSMKDSGSLFRSMTETERNRWQEMIESMFGQFLSVITENREALTEEGLRELEGKVLLASEALELGLIDEIGYQEDAIEAAKTLAGLGDKVRIVTYDRPFGGLLSLLRGQSQTQSPLDFGRMLQANMAQPLLLPEFMVGLAN